MLSSYLQTIREEERKHIAREIHDELGQQLTGLKMDLAFINRKFGEANSEFSDKLTEMMKLVDGSIRTIRQISSDLRPGILDDLGLIPAIEWQGSEFEKRTNIKCHFLNKINESNIDESFATGVFRILQESLTNISRHSGASNVVVEIDQVENSIVLKISDNGKGFIQDKLAVNTTFGLVGMEERAAMLNGALTIVSTPEIGTEVKLIFPAKKVELEKV
ncbi:MAG: sensor histidine kinase [Bacteroidetes bacterium]|nr:sensor histidine kinase [Bacteroidota bacterium]